MALSRQLQPQCSSMPSRRVGSWVGAAPTSLAGERRRRNATYAIAEPPSASSVGIAIQPAKSLDEYHQVAKLRAEAYYENQHSRFVESFKKQFVAQEVTSLQQRTAPTSSPGGQPLCECLVALAAGEGSLSEQVLGCIDIRLPCSKTGVPTAGVPTEDTEGAYILNVVVHEDHRGQGIGRALMHAAMRRAVTQWRAHSLYTHVEADNEVAFHLYTTCGFQEHSAESKYSSATTLGKLVLLHALAKKVVALDREA